MSKWFRLFALVLLSLMGLGIFGIRYPSDSIAGDGEEFVASRPQKPVLCCPDHAAKGSTNPTQIPAEPLNRTLEDIPDSSFRDQLVSCIEPNRERALDQFNAMGIAIEDVEALNIGPDGSLFFACRAPAQLAQPVFLEKPMAESAALLAEASVPIGSPPVYHSKLDAPYAIYLDFNGAIISGTAWNSSSGSLSAYAWSKDSDYSTFSDSEQNIIRQIWQRMAEDYAPFNVDVTTDPAFDPDITGGSNNIGWVLFTRDEDTTGAAMPSKGAGGVAYVGVFGNSSYASYYSPALVYADNLGPHVEQFMAEAGSHEMGHNMGLSHDGASGTTYYSGHSAGSFRWAPIMGSSYNDDITTWSKGEYTGANQKQDDLAIIAGRVGYEPVDAGNSIATAVDLIFSGNTIVDPLTRDFIGDDPNEGIIHSPTDVDYYAFNTEGGTVDITVETFVAEDTRYSLGPNIDLKLTLYDSLESPVATSNPGTTLSAGLNATLSAGTYTLAIEGTGYGDPLATPPTGYTDYGSLGMYFIIGSATQPLALDTPVAGSRWEPGQSASIDWRGTTAGDTLDLELLDDGIFSSTIVSGLDGALATYSWDIPVNQTIGSAYQVRLVVNGSPSTTTESGIFSIQNIAPLVIAQNPAVDADPQAPQSSLTLTFSEQMDSATFDPASDIVSFTGPQGVDLLSFLSGYSWNTGETELTLEFSEQSIQGYYRLVLGATVTDIDGNRLNQDGDLFPGESVEDAYAGTFRIAPTSQSGQQTLYFADMSTDPNLTLDAGWERGSPSQGSLGGPDSGVGDAAVLAYNLSGAYAPNITSPRYATLPAIDTTEATQVQLNFNRWLGIAYQQSGNPANRHADYARIQFSTNGSTWTQLYVNSSALSESGWSSQSIVLPASAENQPTLFIRFGIESDATSESFGWNLDDIEVTAYVQTPAPVPFAPVVVSQTPTGTGPDPQSSLYFEFSQPMDASSFALADIASFTGPSGPVVPTGFSWVSITALKIDFPEQSDEGEYTIVLNPEVLDLFGTAIDQDQDLLPGEPVDDVYTGSFTIYVPPPYTPAENWRILHFGGPENSGDGADDLDFDKDGLANILERGFGTNPTLANDVYRPERSIVTDTEQDYLAITYRQPTGGTGTQGVNYTFDGLVFTVQFSTDLTPPWESGNVTVVSVSDPVDGVETVTVRLDAPLSTPGPQFIRLQVTAAP